MTLKQLDELMEDTKKLPRAQDKVALHMALASIEIARQLVILNDRLANSGSSQLNLTNPKGSTK